MPAALLAAGAEEEPRRAAHNTFMAALVEQGYPGALLYIALQVWIVIGLRRLKSWHRPGETPLLFFRAALGTALVACFISGQFLNLLKAEVQIWLITLVDVLYSISGADDRAASAGRGAEPADTARRVSREYVTGAPL
jgi:O-antigen ligase